MAEALKVGDVVTWNPKMVSARIIKSLGSGPYKVIRHNKHNTFVLPLDGSPVKDPHCASTCWDEAMANEVMAYIVSPKEVLLDVFMTAALRAVETTK